MGRCTYSWRIAAACSRLFSTVFERAVTVATELGYTPCPEARTESAFSCASRMRLSCSSFFTCAAALRPPPCKWNSKMS